MVAAGEGEGGLVLGAGETRGIAQNPGYLGSENSVGGPKKKGGVDSARVGDQGIRPGPNKIL